MVEQSASRAHAAQLDSATTTALWIPRGRRTRPTQAAHAGIASSNPLSLTVPLVPPHLLAHPLGHGLVVLRLHVRLAKHNGGQQAQRKPDLLRPRQHLQGSSWGGGGAHSAHSTSIAALIPEQQRRKRLPPQL